MRKLVILTVLALAGCISGNGYEKMGADAGQKATDVEYCIAYSDAHAGFSPAGLAGGLATLASARGLFKTCMMDRGWREASR